MYAQELSISTVIRSLNLNQPIAGTLIRLQESDGDDSMGTYGQWHLKINSIILMILRSL